MNDIVLNEDQERNDLAEFYEWVNEVHQEFGNITMHKENGIKIFHISYQDIPESLLVTVGGKPCSSVKYQNAMKGDHDYGENDHAHDCFFLVYVLKGSNLEIVEGTPIEMTSKDLLLLTPYTRHHNYHTKDSQILFFHINPDKLYQILISAVMESALVSDFFSDFLNDRYVRKALFFPGCMKEVRYILSNILTEYKKNTYLSSSYIQYLLGILVIHLARDHVFQKKHFRDETSEKMERVIHYISENYKDATLETTARQFGYNPTYLSRKIHRFCGKTFSQLLTDYRLNLALIRLREGNWSVEKIAYECGYHDVSTFYKAFRKKYHRPPRKDEGNDE